MANIFQPIPTYQQRVIAASSVGSMPIRPSARPTFTPDTSRINDVREANGGDGSRTFKDCDGNEVSKIEWKNGIITSTGDEEIQGGCDDSSSSP